MPGVSGLEGRQGQERSAANWRAQVPLSCRTLAHHTGPDSSSEA